MLESSWARERISKKRAFNLTEDLALMKGLPPRTLAPMRNHDRLRVAAGGDERKPPNGSAWRCIASIRAGCWKRFVSS